MISSRREWIENEVRTIATKLEYKETPRVVFERGVNPLSPIQLSSFVLEDGKFVPAGVPILAIVPAKIEGWSDREVRHWLALSLQPDELGDGILFTIGWIAPPLVVPGLELLLWNRGWLGPILFVPSILLGILLSHLYVLAVIRRHNLRASATTGDPETALLLLMKRIPPRRGPFAPLLRWIDRRHLAKVKILAGPTESAHEMRGPADG